MELFRRIRSKTGALLLAGELKKLNRQRSFPGLNNVKTAGVVWDASRPEEFPVLTRFYQKMHERNIEVHILGFFPGKNLPDRYTAIRYLTCLKQQDIDLFYRPRSSEAVSFINCRYDVLIDINFNKLFPLKYITSLSVAGFKAGLTDEDPGTSPFDLMIELNKPAGIDDYLNQVMYYLEMISSEPVKPQYN